MEKIRLHTGFKSVFVVNSIGRNGGLALLWSLEVELDIQNYSQRYINAVVKTNGEGEAWKFTGLYGYLEVAKRKESWTLLCHLGNLMPTAWLSIGDYNEIIEDSEKVRGNLKPRGQMEAFRGALEDCCLTNLGFLGPRYTWNNGQEGQNFVIERLDCAMANDKWRDIFPIYKVEVLASRFSDHASVLLTFQKNIPFRQRRRGLL